MMGDPCVRLIDSAVAAAVRLQAEVQPVHGGIVEIENRIELEDIQEPSAPGPIAFHYGLNRDWDQALSGADVSDVLPVPPHATRIVPHLADEPRRYDTPSHAADLAIGERFEESSQPTRFGLGVVIEEGDDVASSLLKPAPHRRDVSAPRDLERDPRHRWKTTGCGS